MKKFLLTLIALTFVAAPVAADGLDPINPIAVVSAPAADLSWSGIYAGASGNAIWGDETVTVDTMASRVAPGPLSFVNSFDDAGVGAFVGYRYDFGDVVAGGELAVSAFESLDTVTTTEVQLGLDAGDLLPYLSVGYAWTDGDEGMTYGIGADYRFNNGMFVGAAYERMDLNSTEADVFSLRLGFNF